MPRQLVIVTAALASWSVPGGPGDGRPPIQTGPETPPPLAGGAACLDQPPDGVGGLYSDVDCDDCGGGPHLIAENFVLAAAGTVDAVHVRGLYAPGGAAPQFDRFTVAFWTDAGGLPGTVVSKTGPAAATARALTGNDVGGLPEYEYTIDLEPNQDLEAGTWWIEIYNDTSDCPWDCGDGEGTVGILDFLALLAQWGGPGACDFNGDGVDIIDFLKLLAHWGGCPVSADDWVWETGVLDPAAGLPSVALSLTAGNQEQWTAAKGEMAVTLACENPFGCPNEGDCCTANGTPGCNDAACCRGVCEIFPLCCTVSWESLCVDLALDVPACGCIDCEDPARCQLSNLANAFEADGTTWLAADNFVVASAAPAAVTGLCWRGIYFDNSISDECGPGPDDFRVRYYADDGGGLPGALLAEYAQAAGTLTVSAPVLTGQQIAGVADEHEHTASHPPLAVTPGECLWIEVTNFGPAAPCQWFWGLSDDGDTYSMHDGVPPDGYDPLDARPEDYSFCLNLEIGGAPPCPQP